MSGAPTQALVTAMFIPVMTPASGQAIIVTNPPPNLNTNFENVSGGAFLPPATAQGQVVTSGVGPTFGWTAVAPQTVAVTTFNSRLGDVTLTSPDVVTALGFTPYDQDNPAGYQTASDVNALITSGTAGPSTQAPLMDGAPTSGTLALYSRGDHVHPTDTSRYAATNPAGYQTAAQVQAALPAVPVASNAAPVMDGTAAAGALTSWARGDHVHPTDTSRYAASNPAGYQTASQVVALFPPASVLNPIMDGTPNYGVSTAYSREDHVHPTDTSRYAAANPAGYQTAQQVSDAIAAIGGGASPSNAVPLMDGAGAAGSSSLYTRGDHVHPTDTSRAPLNNPVFTGTVTLAQDPAVPLQAVTKQYVDNYTINCGTY